MRTTLKVILISVVLLASVGQAFAYPPDNAAVLYYKAFMILEPPNDMVGKMLKDLSRGNIGLNDQIRQYVERNRKVIKELVTAAEIKNCDWGYDFSEGFNMLLPNLAKCRLVAYLLAADAKILAEKGDYKTALERCITMHKMGKQLGDYVLIERVIGNAIGRISNRCIVEMLPHIAGDSETLDRLIKQLADISSGYPSMKVAIGNDAKVFVESSIKRDREGIIGAIHSSELSKDDLNRADKVFHQHDDNEFYIRSTEYYQSVITRIQIAYDLPYPETEQKLEDLFGEVRSIAKENPEAVMADVLLPTVNRVLMTDTKEKTYFNVVLAGIDIYLIRAKTGKLPDVLPAGLPKDMFSGKDFLYEKTDAGFVLTGQGKDLDKDIVQEQKYEFKVAK